MSDKSKIEWTQATWNPVLGCSKISPGCKGCYAIKEVHRLAGNPNPKIAAANAGLTIRQGGHANWTGKVRLIPERLRVPWRRKKPTMYFVNSLSDLFHEDLPDEAIDQVVAVMSWCAWHTFQVLTKRSERLREYSQELARMTRQARAVRMARSAGYPVADDTPGGMDWPLPNVWLGVSAEDQQRADERIPLLLQTPAAVRFVSVEPLLGPVDLTQIEQAMDDNQPTSEQFDGPLALHYVRHGAPGIDWVIVGGESGPGARPMHPDWVRNIQRQCAAAGVAFFFKQWGEWQDGSSLDRHKDRFVLNDGRSCQGPYDVDQETRNRWSYLGPCMMSRVGKKRAGRLLDGRTWDEMPARRGAAHA